ncbi:venom protease-like protein [Dinothrombium tinctorium]|uniref:Venom protease-like protein n=1 Tax=Dinothrombium tinctorium TaxID=1965070 RepID=A0A3S4Q5C1_9ACAR|nr:venom protease-like protein [Dinothrombium tinctorium]
MTIIPNDQCRNIYPVNDCQICAKVNAGETVCNGDSGSPLYCFKSEGAPYHVIGAVSFGTRTCPENGVIVFTKIKLLTFLKFYTNMYEFTSLKQ